MHNKFKGILIYSKNSSENNLFVKILSEKDEIITGIVYGGLSKKKKIIYQLGYFLNIISHRKNINLPFNIKSEVSTPLLSNIINDKYKLQCILALVSIINLSIIEGQKVEGIFKLSENFINKIIKEKNWLIFFFKFLFDLLKMIGYEVDYTSKDKNFLNFNTEDFVNIENNEHDVFSNHLLNTNKLTNYKSIKDFFYIFEQIFQNNHLNSMNLKLPIHFKRFKQLILEYFNKYNVENN